MSMVEHDLRRQLVTEMHLRKWPLLRAPGMVVQWVRAVEDAERGAEGARLAKAGNPDTSALFPADIPFQSGRFGKCARYVWEQHSESSSLTLFFDGANSQAFLDPAGFPEFAEAISWAECFPGKVLRATRICLLNQDREGEDVVARTGFSLDELVCCQIGETARVWSDFRIQADGYGRFVMAANGTHPGDFTRLVQHVQELGNYRNRALLGLPVAKAYWPRLNQVETRLSELCARVSDPLVTDDQLLGEITALSIDIVAIATATSFRISATIAYASLVDERLAQLNCVPVRGFPSLLDFTNRRFLPAVRTCAAFRERTDQLSDRASQFTSLLRARIETRIENQNGQVLQSMERSAARQLRLQELVEGLSIFALSYYAIGLLAYVIKGWEDGLPHGAASKILAIMVPILVVLIWGGTRRVKRRLSD